jgi:hypothetical protein
MYKQSKTAAPIVPVQHRWAQLVMDRWIDTDTIDRCYRSILLVMLTTDSIDPWVEDFFFLIDSIDHLSQNPCQTDDHRSIGSISTDGIDQKSILLSTFS